jgi:hypothetical protein
MLFSEAVSASQDAFPFSTFFCRGRNIRTASSFQVHRGGLCDTGGMPEAHHAYAASPHIFGESHVGRKVYTAHHLRQIGHSIDSFITSAVCEADPGGFIDET